MPKRQSNSTWVRPVKKAKRTVAKKKKPFYQRTTIYDRQPEELKRLGQEIILSPTLSGTGGTATVVVDGAQPCEQLDHGTLASQRIGNQVNAKGMNIRGFIRNRTGNDKTMLCRIIWFYNKRSANAPIGGSSPMFLQAGVPVALDTLTLDAMYLPTNNQHYSIKSDRMYKIGSSTDNGENVFILNQDFKLNHLIRYDNGTGDNVDYGNLQVMAVCYPSDGSAATGTVVQVKMDATLYFTE